MKSAPYNVYKPSRVEWLGDVPAHWKVRRLRNVIDMRVSNVVEYLEKATADINTATSRALQEIELLKEYRTRLVADIVTGKLDVREAAFKLPEVSDDLSLSDTVEDVTHKKIVDDHAH